MHGQLHKFCIHTPKVHCSLLFLEFAVVVASVVVGNALAAERTVVIAQVVIPLVEVSSVDTGNRRSLRTRSQTP